MGMKLFDSSATFDPAAYGLNIGDTVNVIVVGGGGGGPGVTGTNTSVIASLTEAGGPGATSSFGALLTALGGSGAPIFGGSQGSQGQMLGGVGYSNYATANAYGYNVMGGFGAGGFYPGTLAVQHRLNPNDLRADCFAGFWLRPSSGNGGNIISSSDGYIAGIGARAGRVYTDNTQVIASGPGGAGYGAGGGGVAKQYGATSQYVSWASFGGNSGEVKQLSYALTDLNPVAVTVGLGGVGGGAGLASNGRTYGGDGAGGCVILFW